MQSFFEHGRVKVSTFPVESGYDGGSYHAGQALRSRAQDRVVIRPVENSRRSRGDREAQGLDIVVGISGIGERAAPRAGQTIWKGPGASRPSQT